MRVAVLISGGKDSTLALYLAVKAGYKIKYLISIFSESEESYMWHYPNVMLTKLQAKAMQIPIIMKVSKGEKEKELRDLKKALENIKAKIDCVVSGAIASVYQKSRIDNICKELKLKSFAPLWHKNPYLLWKQMLTNKFEIIITSVACEGLTKDWLGKKINLENFEELKKLSEKYRFNLSFEGGEAETIVTDCPLFKKKLKILKARKEWDKKTNSGYFIVEKVKLIEK